MLILIDAGGHGLRRGSAIVVIVVCRVAVVERLCRSARIGHALAMEGSLPKNPAPRCRPPHPQFLTGFPDRRPYCTTVIEISKKKSSVGSTRTRVLERHHSAEKSRLARSSRNSEGGATQQAGRCDASDSQALDTAWQSPAKPNQPNVVEKCSSDRPAIGCAVVSCNAKFGPMTPGTLQTACQIHLNSRQDGRQSKPLRSSHVRTGQGCRNSVDATWRIRGYSPVE